MNYKTGTDFYIAVTNGSTDLITDESGTLIARYAYEPFGRINPYASDTDVDGDHKRYSGGFWYTGQEYELETDVYDFHARTYDAQTGRFMQPDPVFTAMPGRDSYDSYQYAGNDPVNFMDPDGRKMCSGNTVAALALTAGAAGMVGAAAFGVVGNWTGGGGDCSNRKPQEFQALLLVLGPLSGRNIFEDPGLYFAVSHYYENYIKGHGPSFLGKMNKSELQFSMLYYHQYLQSDGNGDNDSFAMMAYLFMAQDVANPRFDIDEASFYHDQYGPAVFERRNRTATSRWIGQANRIAFSHDSWSRTYAREKKATPKWWGDARGGVATINTAATVLGNMAMAVTGTVLFSVANALTGTKNLGNPRKWRL